ncbi:hypothetical protein [Thermococcus sp.]
MGLESIFKLLEFALLSLSAYWGISVASETLTYIPLKRIILPLSLITALTFREEGLVITFLLLFVFYLLERTGVVLSLVTSVFAFMLFLMGAIASGVLLGILGTALHVHGYEIHGTLEELLHMAVIKK